MSNMNPLLFEVQSAIDSHNGSKLCKLHRQFLRVVDPNEPEEINNWKVLIQEIEKNEGKQKALQATCLVLGLFEDADLLTVSAASKFTSISNELLKENKETAWFGAVCAFGASDLNMPLARVAEQFIFANADTVFDKHMVTVSDTVNLLSKLNGYMGDRLITSGWRVDSAHEYAAVFPPSSKGVLLRPSL